MLEALDLTAENAREGVTAFRAISPIAKEGTAWRPGPGLKQTCKKRVCSLRGPNNKLYLFTHTPNKASKNKPSIISFIFLDTFSNITYLVCMLPIRMLSGLIIWYRIANCCALSWRRPFLPVSASLSCCNPLCMVEGLRFLLCPLWRASCCCPCSVCISTIKLVRLDGGSF